MRRLATTRIIGELVPIFGADRIELAKVDGWDCVVPKGQYKAGDMIIYIEVDSFLPKGDSRWEHLMKPGQITEFDGRTGYVLKPHEFKGVLSRGLVIPIAEEESTASLGADLTALLHIVKYEKPIPDELLAVAIGYTSYLVPTTSLERMENIAHQWESLKTLSWEVTEKLHGMAVSYRWENGKFGVSYSASRLDFDLNADIPACNLARKIGLPDWMGSSTRNRVIQGELVGPKICGNYYGLDDYEFYVYDIFDLDKGDYLSRDLRHAFAWKPGLKIVPELDGNTVLSHWVSSLPDLLQEVQGIKSKLNPAKDIEGWVFKTLPLYGDKRQEFKVISPRFKG